MRLPHLARLIRGSCCGNPRSMPIDPKFGFTEEQIMRDARVQLGLEPGDIVMTGTGLVRMSPNTPSKDHKSSEAQRDRCSGMPLEVLYQIFGELDPKSIVHARGVCRKFKQAAWPSFAATFDQRVFHPTTQGMGTLGELAFNKSAGPYLRTLNLSTVVPCLDSHNRSDGRARVDMDAKNLAQLLWVVLQGLPHLEEICIIDGLEL